MLYTTKVCKICQRSQSIKPSRYAFRLTGIFSVHFAGEFRPSSLCGYQSGTIASSFASRGIVRCRTSKNAREQFITLRFRSSFKFQRYDKFIMPDKDARKRDMHGGREFNKVSHVWFNFYFQSIQSQFRKFCVPVGISSRDNKPSSPSFRNHTTHIMSQRTMEAARPPLLKWTFRAVYGQNGAISNLITNVCSKCFSFVNWNPTFDFVKEEVIFLISINIQKLQLQFLCHVAWRSAVYRACVRFVIIDTVCDRFCAQ